MILRNLIVDDRAHAESILKGIGVDPAGIASIAPKMTHLNVMIPGLEPKAANVIKQEMLSLGGDAAVARGSVSCSVDHTDLVLMGTGKQLRLAAEKFKRQPFGIKSIADKLEQLLSGIDRKDFIVRCRSGALDLHRRTHIMGILNVTPDSFSDGGRYLDPEVALEMACRMVADGADIIDVGGESTRPGAKKVSADEEISRVIPVVERIAKSLDIPISIDTYKAMVAERALDCGADIINDISGLRFDGGMAAVAAEKGCPVVVMHIKGTPADMQKAPSYDSLMDEVIGSLQGSIDIATEAGVEPDNIIVDPGIGFGKRFEDNLGIIKNLGELKVLGKAVLAGASRKAFIGRILDGSDSEERLEGTLAASVIAAANGAHILRVHDVKEAKKAALVTDAIKGSS